MGQGAHRGCLALRVGSSRGRAPAEPGQGWGAGFWGCSLLLTQGAWSEDTVLLGAPPAPAPGTLDEAPVCVFTAGLEVLVCTRGRASTDPGHSPQAGCWGPGLCYHRPEHPECQSQPRAPPRLSR